MPIITLDNYDDQIENNLGMIELITQERKQKENQVVVYGRAFPNEIWDKIKEYNDWTDERREQRKREAKSNLVCLQNRSIRAGRIAPTVRIGDEVCDGEKLCGRVVKIQKASIDIERYAYVGFRRTEIIDITPTGESRNLINIYKWKKDMVKKVRWIGTYQLGDNGGGFVDLYSYTCEISRSSNTNSKFIWNDGWVMGCSFIREYNSACSVDIYGSN